jgi:hypothetical protein
MLTLILLCSSIHSHCIDQPSRSIRPGTNYWLCHDISIIHYHYFMTRSKLSSASQVFAGKSNTCCIAKKANPPKSGDAKQPA